MKGNLCQGRGNSVSVLSDHVHNTARTCSCRPQDWPPRGVIAEHLLQGGQEQENIKRVTTPSVLLPHAGRGAWLREARSASCLLPISKHRNKCEAAVCNGQKLDKSTMKSLGVDGVHAGTCQHRQCTPCDCKSVMVARKHGKVPVWGCKSTSACLAPVFHGQQRLN